jgi:hypothetical protein
MSDDGLAAERRAFEGAGRDCPTVTGVTRVHRVSEPNRSQTARRRTPRSGAGPAGGAAAGLSAEGHPTRRRTVNARRVGRPERPSQHEVIEAAPSWRAFRDVPVGQAGDVDDRASSRHRSLRSRTASRARRDHEHAAA